MTGYTTAWKVDFAIEKRLNLGFFWFFTGTPLEGPLTILVDWKVVSNALFWSLAVAGVDTPLIRPSVRGLLDNVVYIGGYPEAFRRAGHFVGATSTLCHFWAHFYQTNFLRALCLVLRTTCIFLKPALQQPIFQIFSPEIKDGQNKNWPGPKVRRERVTHF